MQVCTSLQADNHASTPPLNFLQARFANRSHGMAIVSTFQITEQFTEKYYYHRTAIILGNLRSTALPVKNWLTVAFCWWTEVLLHNARTDRQEHIRITKTVLNQWQSLDPLDNNNNHLTASFPG